LSLSDLAAKTNQPQWHKEKLSAGFHKTTWQAGNYASGIFIYQLQIEGENIETKFFRKKMLLVK
jgi:hypothetical protein